MEGFFQPPPNPWPPQAPGTNAPPWTGRPQGQPPGEVVSDLALGASQSATVSIAYIDAYPEGFELEITAVANVAFAELARAGDRSPDVFGRHWPMAGEARDVLPPQLLRVGVQYADGRRATTIAGHSRPLEGPLIWDLGGGGSGSGGKSTFHQGYWISPLPPEGVLSVLCEWPALDIPLVQVDIEAALIRDGAERARALFGDGQRVHRDGRELRLGTDADVAFIAENVIADGPVGIAIPPGFEAYCALALPEEDAELDRHEQAIIALLTAQTDAQPWWLGYLDTGASDVVFPYAPRTQLYHGHGYVLVEAGPDQAAGWRARGWHLALPDLMFPADRSWLLSTTWDEAFSAIGGSERLIATILGHPVLGPRAARKV